MQKHDNLKVLVTGATGAIGPRIVEALYHEGHHIRTLSLTNRSPHPLPEQVEKYVGDITDMDIVQKAVQGCDAVIHLAALLHIFDPPDSLRPQYEKINVGGTENVVRAALQANVSRIIYASTINVYGATNGQVISEDSLPNPETFYAATKLAAEKIVLEARTPTGDPLGVVFRLGAVYGTQVKGNYKRLYHSINRKRFIPIGKGKNRRTLVYDKDIAQAVLLGIYHPKAPGNIFNVTDGSLHTVAEILEAIYGALGMKSPKWSVPVGLLRFIVGFLETGARLTRQEIPISQAIIDKYVEDVAVDGRRIQQELGFVPAYDLVAGWKDMVAELNQII